MPELPEVERARQTVVEALNRTITAIDDTDSYECRPHAPGDIADALVGGKLTEAHRRGKTMWCDTVTADGAAGPTLGIHLGMGGHVVVTDGRSEDTAPGAREQDKPVWTRFRLQFEDGGELRLFDKRRLGRVRLEPDVDALGPDAAEITRDEFRERVGRSKAPIKARLLDQSVLAGVGNLLGDEVLWEAEVHPERRANTLDEAELDALRRVLRSATRDAIRKGGVHTGEVITSRHKDGTCPRCGAPMTRGTVGGRTTWWCSQEQVL